MRAAFRIEVSDCVDAALTLALSLDRERDLEKQRKGKRTPRTPSLAPPSTSLVYSHRYFFGLAMPGGESTVYSTTSTP